MSLINDMLRDLESRRANELGHDGLQREIRPLPPEARRFPALRLVVLALILAGLAGGVWLAGDWLTEPGPVASRPAEEFPPAAAATSGGVAGPVPADTPREEVVREALRLAMSLESLPAEVSPAQPGNVRQESPKETTPPRSEAAASTARPEEAKRESVPPVPSRADVSQGSIEKTVLLGSPRERADAEFRRAQALLAGGQTTLAQEALQAALRQDATYIPARQALLRLLLEARRLDEAAGVLQDGLEHHPSQTGWAMSLARLLVERGDLMQAERTLARYAGHALGQAEYLGFHGHLLTRLGQFRPAAEKYQQAVRLAPAEGRWWFGLAQALEGDSSGQEAREAYRRALATGTLNADLATLAEQKTR